MRVVIVPDKFNGTLTAKQATSAIACGWKRTRPDDELVGIPMSDGGDGFGTILSGLLGAVTRRSATVDAAHRPCRAKWWWEANTRTAIIEAARVVGLAALPPEARNPLELDTTGLGRVLQGAARLRPRRCLIGLGGSATNDGGFGLARALGWQFLTSRGEVIRHWLKLISCVQIIPPGHRLRLGRLTVALDVQNPLLGAQGCTRIYGPQKGLHSGDFARAEQALRKMSKIMERQHQTCARQVAGAGAAGGLGFGLMTFLRAKPVTGFSVFEREASLTQRIRSAELVITGEGCLDSQSLMGKGTGELLRLCERQRVPCIAIGGKLNLSIPSQRRFEAVYALASQPQPRDPMSHPRFCLARAAAQAAAELTTGAPSRQPSASRIR